MFSEYQRVRLILPISPLEAGAEGVIVMLYDFAEPVGYEVEFLDAEGNTTVLLTLHDRDLEAVEEGERKAW